MHLCKFVPKNDDEYFGYPAISQSQISKLTKKNENFEAFWKECALNPFKEAVDLQFNDAVVFGKFYHAVLFEPKTLNDVYKVVSWSTIGRGTKSHKKAVLENPGYTVISPKELAKALSMKKYMAEHELAAEILNGSYAESPIFWRDDSDDDFLRSGKSAFKKTDLPCKVKIDGIKQNSDGDIYMIDLKTTNDMDSRIKNPHKYGYDIQCAMTNEAVREKTGKEISKYIYVFQSTVNGEEGKIKVTEMMPESIHVSKIRLYYYMEQIAKRLKAAKEDPENMEKYFSWEKQEDIYPMSLPNWLKTQWENFAYYRENHGSDITFEKFQAESITV